MKPEIGQLARASDLPDVPASYGNRLMAWQPCAACGTPRWVETRNRVALRRWCYPCGRREGKRRGTLGREKHPGWKGGRHVTNLGYVQVTPKLDDPLISMADSRGRVYEHRYVMARALGRPLTSDETVHHRNGEKQDNRLENLEILARGEHTRKHHGDVQALLARIAELEDEIAELRSRG